MTHSHTHMHTHSTVSEVVKQVQGCIQLRLDELLSVDEKDDFLSLQKKVNTINIKNNDTCFLFFLLLLPPEEKAFPVIASEGNFGFPIKEKGVIHKISLWKCLVSIST